MTVSVGWYGTSLPIIMWTNPYLGTHMTLLMALTQYTGNAIKDLVSAPRPAGLTYASVRCHIAQTSANAKEKEKNAAEYGLPSSHAMNSLAYNFYLVLALHKNKALADDMSVYWYASVVVFVSTVALSRVYLGLHTPIDILGGAVAGLTVVTAYASLQDEWGVLDTFLYGGSHLSRIGIAAVASLALLRLHPTPESHTPSYEFSTSFIGVAFGVICGVRTRIILNPNAVYSAFGLVSTPFDPLTAFRFLVGLSLLGVAKIATKALLTALLPYFYTYIFPHAVRRLWQPPIVGHPRNGLKQTPDGRDADIDATVRFFSYAAIGYVASCYVMYL